MIRILKFIGADNKIQPFSITADLARNVLKGTEQIQLEMPKADIAINEGGWLVLSAKSGLYDQKKKSLNLNGYVINQFYRFIIISTITYHFLSWILLRILGTSLWKIGDKQMDSNCLRISCKSLHAEAFISNKKLSKSKDNSYSHFLKDQMFPN